MYTFEDLIRIVEKLRDKDKGCPWDKEQTHESMKKCLTDECQEVLLAIDNKDTENLCEELGDLLFQVMIHSQIGKEEKEYIEASRKLIKEEREFLKIRLKALGWKVWDSQANYLFFQVPEDQDELGKKLKEKKVLIRSCSNYYGLGPGYYRICVKTRRENEQLLKAVEEIL